MNIRIIAVLLLIAFIAYSFSKKFTIVPKKKVTKPEKKKPKPEPEPEPEDDPEPEKES